MKRRDFLKGTLAGAAAFALRPARTLAKGGDVNDKPGVSLAAPCGLYCGICGDRAKGECHGCGCDCGDCAGAAHAARCEIAQCAAGRKLESCAECKDLACTRLIQFCHHPIWRTHSPVIDNLRRRKAIGTAAWLSEQQAHWADEERRRAWLALGHECSDRWRKFKGK